MKGDKEYGLPTAIDDEVLFALIQITKLYNDFREREVKFSRYEVLRLLGWRDDSVNYRRLTESLRRWKRVNLSYEKAWWNKLDQTWMTEEFNIIDNLSIPEDTGRRPGRPPKRRTHATTSFHWNKVVFQSFQAENLKRIDAKTYFSLRSSVAKRMYRFLDKRFYHKPEWPFDLHDFAFEHVGLSRSYEKNAGKIKEKLQPGLDELEAIGFISPLPKEKRYTKTGTRLDDQPRPQRRPGEPIRYTGTSRARFRHRQGTDPAWRHRGDGGGARQQPRCCNDRVQARSPRLARGKEG